MYFSILNSQIKCNLVLTKIQIKMFNLAFDHQGKAEKKNKQEFEVGSMNNDCLLACSQDHD